MQYFSSVLKLFLAFAVALQLLSEFTEKEVTAGAAVLFTIQAKAMNKEGYVAKAINKEGYVACFSVGDASVPFDSCCSISWFIV